ncbi:hypothetical protein EW145_g8628 [Phellinidium pouzarii]|uniref:Zinc finger protein n=1 Tax=Phellinidium pouzarii TaxID=167371 RepID=A0A4S4K4L4_9AGAM|nr:hypothetical protein EW145_g8628 [Phellinidium pouzarii]
MTFMCKQCRRAFRKDVAEYEESDEFCPHCDNHYAVAVIEAKTPQPVLTVQTDDVRVDARMLKDERAPPHTRQTMTDEELAELMND